MLDGLRIMVIEDAAAIRSIVARMLRQLKCDYVYEAGSVDSAWPLFSSQKLDLALLDIELQGENGLDMLKRLRSEPGSINRTLPVIVLTSHAKPKVVEAAAQAGADSYLVKPVQPKRLGDRILSTIDAVQDREFLQYRRTEMSWGIKNRS